MTEPADKALTGSNPSRAISDDIAERYCSSCAWPYECAEAQACHRREAGEVRSPYPGSDSSASPFTNGTCFIAGREFRIIGLDLARGPDRTGFAVSSEYHPEGGEFTVSLSAADAARWVKNWLGEWGGGK